MRVFGVDFGFRRIGLAVGETEFAIATARPPLEASGKLKTDADHLAQRFSMEEAELLVLGKPEYDDDPRMAKVCDQLVGHLQALNITVVTIDESMTSVESEAALLQTDRTAAQRRKVRDGEAACRILERYFASLA